MYFDLWWGIGSLVYETALVFSLYRVIKLAIYRMTHSLVINFFIYIFSFVTLFTMIYYALITE